MVVSDSGWPRLFSTAFRQSRNAMVLLDANRTTIDVNSAFVAMIGHRRDALIGRPVWRFVSEGPTATPAEWRSKLAEREFTGQLDMLHADGSLVPVQWAATVEVVTGHRLVLFVVINSSRWGDRFRPPPADAAEGELTRREREIVRLVADGSSGPEIAEDLGIAHDTVRTHVRNAMHKLGARSRAQLVAIAVGSGLVLVDAAGDHPAAVSKPD